MSAIFGRLKNKLSTLTGNPPGYTGMEVLSPQDEIEAIVSDQFNALAESRIKIKQSDTEISANGKDPKAPFAGFLARYDQLRKTPSDELQTLRQDHPFMSDFAEMAIKYMAACDKLPERTNALFRRHFYRFISIFNSTNAASHIFDYKKGLPRVGLFYFPNPGPKNFVVDALSGMTDLHDMEPGKLVELAWQLRGLNRIDFAAYQKALKLRAEMEVERLPDDFYKRFPAHPWLINEVSAAVQYQWALVELLKLKYWDVIFLGAAETPLAQALYDVPKELLPPIISLCHGIPSGDPLMNFFNRIDRVIVRCEPEKEFYTDMGVSEDQITFVGSTSIEDFPKQSALQHTRSTARSLLGLDESDTIIVYATTYDISIYNTKSPAEILDLMIDSFKAAVEQRSPGLKNPVLYIKYHPSPASDPHFSFSRNQYPFAAFSALSECGYRVRLTNDIESVLAACDCFVAHESSTLTEALDWGVPTISIKMHKGKATPLLGKRAYAETTCHKHFSVYDKPETIGASIANLCHLERADVYEQSHHLWSQIFATGRSAGLMKTAQLVAQLLQASK